MNRSEFVSLLTGVSLVSAIPESQPQRPRLLTESMPDEHVWEQVRQSFSLDEQAIDLRTHAASPLPATTLERFMKEYRHIQAFPAGRSHGIAEGAKDPLRVQIARQLNSSVEEVALMRSTTEALNNALMGFPFKKGDEVLASVHEYDSMMGSLYQRQKKDGIVVKQVVVPYQPTSHQQIIDCFKSQVTPRTRLILLSHIVWISGQIYPVEELCQWARLRGIATVIDAAQSFSHLPIDVAQIGCDYLGAPLHKWCAAPLGTGFLYVRKENIAPTYPLMGSYQHEPDAPVIEKFENFGSITPVFDACTTSIAYWESLGMDVKRRRMQYLKEYWTTQVAQIPDVRIVTNIDASHSGGLAYFTVRGRSATDIKDRLLREHSITVQAIEGYKNQYVDYKDVNAVGVATPVFVLPRQLNVFVECLKKVLGS